MKYEIINAKKNELGLTNAQLAEITGITLSTIDKITSGANQNPKMVTLKAIAKAIGCTLDDFDDDYVAPLSQTAITFAHNFDKLDDHGKQVISAIMDLELKRINDVSYAAEVERFNSIVDDDLNESTAL